MPYPWDDLDVLTHTDLNAAVAAALADSAAVAADLAAALARIDALEDDAWTDYKTGYQVIGSGSNPTMSTSVTTAEWKEIAPGVICARVELQIAAGFAAAPGSGTYRFPLPFSAADYKHVGSALVIDAAPSLTFFPSVCNIHGTFLDAVEIFRAVSGSPTAAALGATSITWAAGDIIRFEIIYRKA